MIIRGGDPSLIIDNYRKTVAANGCAIVERRWPTAGIERREERRTGKTGTATTVAATEQKK